jgi:hypothetical protein
MSGLLEATVLALAKPSLSCPRSWSLEKYWVFKLV